MLLHTCLFHTRCSKRLQLGIIHAEINLRKFNLKNLQVLNVEEGQSNQDRGGYLFCSNSGTLHRKGSSPFENPRASFEGGNVQLTKKSRLLYSRATSDEKQGNSM